MNNIPKFETKFTPNDVEAMFVSADKTTIKLPVPLGTEVYEAWTGCCSICRNRKYTNQINTANDKKVINCSNYACCHTTPPKFAYKTIVTLKNLNDILQHWHQVIFETEEQAIAVGKARAQEHLEYLKSCGVEFTTSYDGNPYVQAQ